MSDNTVQPLEYYEKLGEIELGRGDVISTIDLASFPGEYPVYSSSAVGTGEFGRYGRFMFEEELITWSIDGGGRPFYRPKHRYSVTNVCGYLRIKKADAWDYRYLHALLEKLQSGIQFDYQMKAHPSVIRELYRFRRISLDEQQLIGEILYALDTAINETEAIIAKLKAVKEGLLHDLLTRGIDANGELRPPQDEAPHLYKDSPLGGIPKDWSLMKLGQILSEPTKNGLYKSSQFHGRGPLMVQMGGLFSGDAVTFDTATRVSVTPFEFNNFGLAEGDLLFARRSLVFEGAGQCVIVRNLPEPATFESSIVRVRVRSNEAEPEFVCQYLRSYKSYIQRRTLIRQVAVSGVSSADIRELLVALPSPEEQRVHVARQLEVQTRIDLETMSVEKLRSQKSGLMDDLLTGRVRVTPLLNSNNEKGAS